MEPISFSETQGFKTWWAWAGVASLNILFLYGIVQQIFLGIPFGSNPAPDWLLILLEVFLLLFLLFLMSVKLKTTINGTGIYYRFYPFQTRGTLIEWHELTDAYIRQYNSFHEYGGWGMRTGNANTGKAINTSASSDKGLQLQFGNGKRLLIGTRKPQEIEQILTVIIASGKLNRGI